MPWNLHISWVSPAERLPTGIGGPCVCLLIQWSSSELRPLLPTAADSRVHPASSAFCLEAFLDATRTSAKVQRGRGKSQATSGQWGKVIRGWMCYAPLLQKKDFWEASCSLLWSLAALSHCYLQWSPVIPNECVYGFPFKIFHNLIPFFCSHLPNKHLYQTLISSSTSGEPNWWHTCTRSKLLIFHHSPPHLLSSSHTGFLSFSFKLSSSPSSGLLYVLFPPTRMPFPCSLSGSVLSSSGLSPLETVTYSWSLIA